MNWIKVPNVLPKLNSLAYDAIGDSIGLWDGYTFIAFTNDYSFDIEYTKNRSPKVLDDQGNICGHITHWMPLPEPPDESA